MHTSFVRLSLVVLCVGLLAFAEYKNTNIKTNCEWYLYDDPAITDPEYDFPINLEEALDANNYRLATWEELWVLCEGTDKICAICAQPSYYNYGIPNLGYNQYINDQIRLYFLTPEELRIPNTNFIKEKFLFY